MGFGSPAAENESFFFVTLANFVKSSTATNVENDALLIHICMYVLVLESLSWDRKNLTSLFQSKMLLPAVLFPKGVLPQQQAVTVTTVPLPKLCGSLAASEF